MYDRNLFNMNTLRRQNVEERRCNTPSQCNTIDMAFHQDEFEIDSKDLAFRVVIKKDKCPAGRRLQPICGCAAFCQISVVSCYVFHINQTIK